VTAGARASINLGAIQRNLEQIRRVAGDRKISAVIKANAYGHGLLPVARALCSANLPPDALAVARLSEAQTLRDADIAADIQLLAGAFSKTDTQVAADLQLQLCVHNRLQVDWLRACKAQGLVVWLKADTGMRRLGFPPDDIASLVDELEGIAAIDQVNLMTHFASAERIDGDDMNRQIAAFGGLLEDFTGDVSLNNSAAILSEAHSDCGISDKQQWVRPGISLFGVSPFAEKSAAQLGLQPAMRFESRLVAIKPIKRGDRVGYGGRWQASGDTVLGIVAAGYADGVPRASQTDVPVLINDRRVPVVGQVSMDSCAVDLGPDALDSVGDSVLLWGDELPVEEVARHAEVLPYEVICGVPHREAPVYVW